MRAALGGGLLGGLLVALVPAGAVGADPAAPTDYATVVLGIEPATPTIAIDVVGGDSFLELTVERGTEVVVLGYWNEEYLRFAADGTVSENLRAPTREANESRFGTASGADGDPAAEWAQVATDGSYAWHDHRAHWMSRERPPGRPGDRVQTGAVPLRVDGAEVRITVAVVWEHAPSRVPLAAGAIVGGFAVLTVLSSRQRVASVVVGAGAGAAAIGWWQVASVPPETGPSPTAWLLPAIAAASAAVALTLGRSLVSHSLVMLAGLQLALWTFLRRDGLTRALLPTAAPFWLDRGVTVAAGVVGAAAVVAGGLALLRLPAAEG